MQDIRKLEDATKDELEKVRSDINMFNLFPNCLIFLATSILPATRSEYKRVMKSATLFLKKMKCPVHNIHTDLNAEPVSCFIYKKAHTQKRIET